MVGVCGACTADSAEPAPDATAPTASQKFAPYETTASVDADLNEIQTRLIQDRAGWVRYDDAYFTCMAEAGFNVPVEVRPQRQNPEGPGQLTGDVAFELAPIGEVESRGYAAGTDNSEPDDALSSDPIAADPLSQWIAALSPAEQARYSEADMGPTDGPRTAAVTPEGGELSMPATGCHAIATQARVGDTTDYLGRLALFNEINLSIIAATDSDHEYVDAKQRWIECATNNGINVQDPLELTGSVEQAVIDRSCRDEVDLARFRQAARLEAANERRDQIAELIATINSGGNTGSRNAP